jgi:hypothetical protein
MKRGELSMEVIIIAAIALLVLVILSVLVLRQSVGVSTGTSCQGVGGTCDYDCGPGTSRSYHTCSDGNVCCLPLTNEQT